MCSWTVSPACGKALSVHKECCSEAALLHEEAVLLSNKNVGPRLFLAVLQSPRIAASVLPGQFVHMKIPQMEGHILRRPFSVYAVNAEVGTLEILYQTVGFGSERLSGMAAGVCVDLIGPIGHGWQLPEGAAKVLLAAGGVGAAPLFMLAEKACMSGAKVDVVLGAQTEAALVTRERYVKLIACSDGDDPRCATGACGSVRCATDDGSFGHAGFCTELVEKALQDAEAAGEPYDYVAVCGPLPVMRIASGMAAKAQVPCEVSMEKLMACGIGACLSCVVDTVDGKRRACADGPVFDSQKVVW